MEAKRCYLTALLVLATFACVSQARPLQATPGEAVVYSGPSLADVESSARAIGLGPNWKYEGNPAAFLAAAAASQDVEVASTRRELEVKSYESEAQTQLALAWHCLLISQYWAYGTPCFADFNVSLYQMRDAQAELTISHKQTAVELIAKAKTGQDACRDKIDDNARDKQQALTYLTLADDYVGSTLQFLPKPAENVGAADPAPLVDPTPAVPAVPAGTSGNPIDDCWMAGDWRADRQQLADCAEGYGAGALGGKGGEIYTVTSTEDDPVNPAPGTLRWGVVQDRPLWIIFAHDMTFSLKAELIVTSFKTIDGRGANVLFENGACMTLQEVTNVIVHNIKFHNCIPSPSQLIISSLSHTGHRGSSDGDSVSIWRGSDIWVDHCDFVTSADGLVDIVAGSTAVTISNNFFSKHDKVMLLGAHDGELDDNNLKVTVVLNKFGPECTQRMPRGRRGHVHVLNNYYPVGWGIYAIGGSSDVTIRSEGNFFVAPEDPTKKSLTKLIEGSWSVVSVDDHLENGAVFPTTGTGFSPDYAYTPVGVLDVPTVTARAGAIAY
eukprot:jgi/Mesen1/2303/ME000155S01391